MQFLKFLLAKAAKAAVQMNWERLYRYIEVFQQIHCSVNSMMNIINGGSHSDAPIKPGVYDYAGKSNSFNIDANANGNRDFPPFEKDYMIEVCLQQLRCCGFRSNGWRYRRCFDSTAVVPLSAGSYVFPLL